MPSLQSGMFSTSAFMESEAIVDEWEELDLSEKKDEDSSSELSESSSKEEYDEAETEEEGEAMVTTQT